MGVDLFVIDTAPYQRNASRDKVVFNKDLCLFNWATTIVFNQEWAPAAGALPHNYYGCYYN